VQNYKVEPPIWATSFVELTEFSTIGNIFDVPFLRSWLQEADRYGALDL
jgi:hypothetical protein